MGSCSLSFALFILAGLVWNSYGGVDVETITPGDGVSFPRPGQTVTVHYTGTLTNGLKFDCSRDRGMPFEFKIGEGNVIKGYCNDLKNIIQNCFETCVLGWDEGIAQMTLGETARLTISPDYAYGAEGIPPKYIPENQVFNKNL